MKCGIILIKKEKIWIWRAVDCIRNRTIGWVIDNRDAQTFQKLYEQLKDKVKMFYTDNWEIYRKVIPSDKLTQGKKHTISIEQNNSIILDV